MNKQEIIDLLKSFEPGQPFSIEELVRTIGKNKGEKWAGVFEVEIQNEIASYLLKEKLILESGVTKTYILIKNNI